MSELATRKEPHFDGPGAVDVLVVGGGVIGLSIAWRCAQRGLRTKLFERGKLGEGASWAAAGMLAPVSEMELGEAGRRILDLGLQAARMWPDFASELSEATGSPSQLRADGALMVAHDRDAAEALERMIAFRTELGLEVRRLRPSETRELEPALAPNMRLAARLPTERSVDPRWLSQALAEAARGAGAVLMEGTEVASLLRAGDRVTGVHLANGSSVTAGRVVIAAGAWSGAFGELPVRPVKGQILRLRDPAGAGLLSHVLRFEGGYLVPRGDGRYTLGATVEEQGFDASLTANAAYQLLRDASRVLPGVLELDLEEMTCGFRPGTPDNVPVIGNDSLQGLLWATGHYRNGILLTPVTAQLVLAALDGSSHPGDALLAPANSAGRS